MRKALKVGLIAALVTGLLLATLEFALSKTENDFFQFCTTKAYGWPLPWRIDYCECEGNRTVYPRSNQLVNLITIAAGSLGSFSVFTSLSFFKSDY